MNCTICGKATSRGTLLCKPCKAALKRARQLTVLDVPQRPARVRKGVRPATPPEPRSGIDMRLKPIQSAPAVRMLLGVVVIGALAGAAYVAAREFVGRAATSPAPATAVAQPRASDSTTTVAATPREATDAQLPAPTPLPELTSSPPARPNALAGSTIRTASDVAATVSLVPPRNAKEVRVQEPTVAVASTYPPLDSFGPPPEPPKQAPLPVAVRASPPPQPDRWQAMNDALTRCANEGGFAGFICDQRVRLASCDGYWGRVAQCPVPPENPH